MRLPTLAIHQYAKPRNLEIRAATAEENGIYAVESKMPGVTYAYEDGCLAIATSTGWVKMRCDTADTLAEELRGILNDIETLRRMQCLE